MYDSNLAYPVSTIFEHGPQPGYRVRVRYLQPPAGGTSPQIYLWGSPNIQQNMPLPALLHIRNDVFGDTVTLSTVVGGGAPTTLGTLGPGECVSIPLQGLSGVLATCQFPSVESVVACLIKAQA
jgi:hypothetical protein